MRRYRRPIIQIVALSLIVGGASLSLATSQSSADPVSSSVAPKPLIVPLAASQFLPQVSPSSTATTTVDTTVASTVAEPVRVSQPAAADTTTPTSNPATVEATATVAAVPETTPNTMTVTIQWQYPNKSKQYSLELPADSTVDTAMQQASQNYQFSYVTKNHPGLGKFVDEIAGQKSNKAQGWYWIYYMNGKLANAGVSTVKVKAGDTISWKYESSI
jgi:hypothetical protein